ncbi:MAG: CopG family antitoxin [Alphaproteobacteria bacterium]|nr:MAG: hypothetical protein B6I23_00815 [Rickettsiaceae bacterium 4572_127]
MAKKTIDTKPLDDYEKELFGDLENTPIKQFSIREQQNYLQKAKLFAESYFENKAKKDKSISLRVNSDLLEMIKQKAKLKGIPYQTLISSVLHKYITGQLG